MKTKLLAACCLLAINATALAADNHDQGMAGPMSRQVTKQDKKGVDAMYKSIEASMKKGDVNGWADNIDFPVMMVTDNRAGQFMTTSVDREAFVKMMGDMMSHRPKDMKMAGKHSARFLSDTLAAVDEDQTMSMGKMKGAWKSESLVVLKDGKWKMKMMAEAGWGDTMKDAPAASGTAMGAGTPTAQPATQPAAVPVHH
jgi:hypothetical protein